MLFGNLSNFVTSVFLMGLPGLTKALLFSFKFFLPGLVLLQAFFGDALLELGQGSEVGLELDPPLIVNLGQGGKFRTQSLNIAASRHQVGIQEVFVPLEITGPGLGHPRLLAGLQEFPLQSLQGLVVLSRRGLRCFPFRAGFQQHTPYSTPSKEPSPPAQALQFLQQLSHRSHNQI
jgi:hypothetical protein